MSSQCVICFDNNENAVYYSGQTLLGTAEIITVKDKTIRGIHITINGFAQVRWTEDRRRKTREGKTEKFIETFGSDEQYLSSRTFVQGQDSGSIFELKAGKYVYPFQLHLPPQLPSSFNGVFGQIRYEVIVTIDRPYKYDNVFRQPFTVISPLDLNVNPIYKAPIERKEEKHFCCGSCFYCKNEPIKVKLEVPLSAYAPGQKINFRILAENESTIDCRGVKIKLERIVKFSSRTPETKYRLDTVKVEEKYLGPVLKLSKKDFTDFLKIPAIPPSSLDTCSIIKIKYQLEVTVKVAGLHTNLHIVVPITIGSVPIFSSVSGAGNVIVTQPRTQLPSGHGDHPPEYTAIAPPSYEEATHTGKVFVDKDEEEKYGKAVPYLPKYPVYHTAGTPSINPPAAGGSSVSPPVGAIHTNSPSPYPAHGKNHPAPQPVSPPQASNLPVSQPLYPPSQPEAPPQEKPMEKSPRPIGWNA